MKKRYWLGLLVCFAIILCIPLSNLGNFHTHKYSEWKELTSATCVQDQVLIRYCLKCEHVEYKAGEKSLGHIYSELTQLSPATCTDYEIIKFKCLSCNENITTTGSAPLGHLFEENDWVELIPGNNCMESNTLTHKCQRCDISENKFGSTKGPHIFSEEWEHYKDATCISYNILKRNCLFCNQLQTQNGNILGSHHFNFEDEESPATCTTAQVLRYKCDTCFYTITKEGAPAIGHQFKDDDWYEILPATCISYNILTHKCQKCEVYENKKGTIIGGDRHEYDSWFQVSTATCVDDALMRRDCIYCSDYEIKPGTKAVGHSFSSNNWIVKTPATCCNYAILEQKCNICGENGTKFGTQYGSHQYKSHQLSSATCTEHEILQHICDYCNDTKTSTGLNALGHEFNSFTQIIVPTCTNDEVLQSKCTRCDAIQTKTGDLAYGHNYSIVSTVREASCTEYEILQYRCIRCLEEKNERGANATGHNYSTFSTIDPTPTSLGCEIHSCTCGDSYKDNYTCLVTYQSLDEKGESDPLFPQIEDQIVAQNSLFTGAIATADYTPIEYRIYESELDYSTIKNNDVIDNSLNITIVWKRSELANLLHVVKKLEDLSKEYNSSNYPVRAMQYIRSINSYYTSSAWNLVAGTVSSDFVIWIKNKDAGLVNELKSLKSYKITATNEYVDFRHLIAIVNGMAYSPSSVEEQLFRWAYSEDDIRDLIDWGGDLCQLIQQLKNKNLTGAELQAEADRLFALTGNGSEFGDQDLHADIDALGIYEIYKLQSTKSIYEAMRSYYNNLKTSTDRKKIGMRILFADYCNDDGTIVEGLNQTEFINKICNLIVDNGLLKTWCSQNGVDISSASDKELVAAATSFVKYFINQ